ncbi:MAG: bifunctional hydroxymethylpyrimidine kinase/phosphomethylpyrimidine kinase [Bacteroidales bacterium]|jgi:hydroxymethylpyrimidine/phosphomethylpyrimidine kinase|nr:bifunctional hydroxymethylpyrimidine kinase/phosphomethylpyrimidine kinase [Bacteroidales bacterium]
MKKIIFALTIAGSDSGGGAGIQADLKTFSALGVFGCSAITAVTAQNTLGVRDIQAINPNIVSSQIDAVMEDFDIKAIKTGMLFSTENVFAIKECFLKYKQLNRNFKFVLDPVMIATSGSKLILSDTAKAICEHLFPFADIITPNIDEAETFLNAKISNVEDMKSAAQKLKIKYNIKSVLIKGGHLQGKDITDVLFSDNGFSFFKSDKIDTHNTHGTGCTLSSAITAFLAKGQSMETAVGNAKTYITQAIATAKDMKLGHGHGSVNHFFSLFAE